MTSHADAGSATSVSSTDSLGVLVRRGASQKTIAAHLDGLAPYARLQEVLAVQGSLVGKLYDAVAGAEPLALTDIVPASETATVILEGRNSLPAFTRFQKRFVRIGDRIVGYNHQLMSVVTGPGYFVTQPPTAGETHPDELFFDYTAFDHGSEGPSGVPASWPPFKPNSAALSRLVYMSMKDYCRRVADGVLVGKAYKNGAAQNAYFTLTRPY